MLRIIVCILMKSRHWSIATIMLISLLALAGIWLLLYSTPVGLGFNDDSVAYIAGARSIMEGDGYRESWLVSNGPVIHFPPGFPAVLALIGWVTGLDPVRGARALNGLLYGLNIGLAGWLAWRMTKSHLAGIVSAALLLFNSSLLYIHTRAMSEPLYIFLMLVSFILLDLYFKHQRNYYLVILGIVLAVAYLARYAALSLLATMLALMLVLHADWRKRISSFLIVAASSFPWIIAWAIRNRIMGGTVSNRVLGWHPITLENWVLALNTLSEFLIPVAPWRRAIPNLAFAFVILFIALVIILWTLNKGLPHLFKPSQVDRPNELPLTNGLYIIAYLLSLMITMTLFDPATKFQVRILSPIYVSIILLAVTLAAWLWRSQHAAWRPVIILISIVFLGTFAYGQVKAIPVIQNDSGFASTGWRYSKAIMALNEMPPNVLILTNEPGLVYLHTGRPTGVLPRPGEDFTQVKQAVLDGDIVIALFRVNRADENTMAYYDDIGYGLYQTDYSRTWIFSAFPTQETK